MKPILAVVLTLCALLALAATSVTPTSVAVAAAPTTTDRTHTFTLPEVKEVGSSNLKPQAPRAQSVQAQVATPTTPPGLPHDSCLIQGVDHITHTTSTTGTYSFTVSNNCNYTLNTLTNHQTIQNVTAGGPVLFSDGTCNSCSVIETTSPTVNLLLNDSVHTEWDLTIVLPSTLAWQTPPDPRCTILSPSTVKCIWPNDIKPLLSDGTATPTTVPTNTPGATATPIGGGVNCGQTTLSIISPTNGHGVAVFNLYFTTPNRNIAHIIYRVAWINRNPSSGRTGEVLGDVIPVPNSVQTHTADVGVTGTSWPFTVLATLTAVGIQTNGGQCEFTPAIANGYIL